MNYNGLTKVARRSVGVGFFPATEHIIRNNTSLVVAIRIATETAKIIVKDKTNIRAQIVFKTASRTEKRRDTICLHRDKDAVKTCFRHVLFLPNPNCNVFWSNMRYGKLLN